MPEVAAEALENLLLKAGMETAAPGEQPALSLDTRYGDGLDDQNFLVLGDVEAPIAKEGAYNVPDIHFIDNETHLRVMRQMLQEYVLGEPILLVGNQGTGKNKLTGTSPCSAFVGGRT